jgi:hypothetical protein
VFGFQPNLVNTATVVAGQLGNTGNAQVKAAVDPNAVGGNFFDFTGFQNPNGVDSFLTQINETLTNVNFNALVGAGGSGVSSLSTLFANLLPGHQFIQAGDTFNAAGFGTTANGGNVGDTDENIFGNNSIPGVEVSTPPGNNIPEIDPNSIAGALTVLGFGLAYMTERVRRNKK